MSLCGIRFTSIHRSTWQGCEPAHGGESGGAVPSLEQAVQGARLGRVSAQETKSMNNVQGGGSKGADQKGGQQGQQGNRPMQPGQGGQQNKPVQPVPSGQPGRR